MKVIAYDPAPNHEFGQKHGIPFVSAEECYSQGDYVSLHYPLSEETRRGVNQRVLRLMKPTAFLINTARGGIIDEAALTEHLREKRIAGAGLDVLECEPPAKDNPLFQLPNVVCTAHTAGVDTASRDKMALIAAHAIVNYFRGEWPGDIVVNPECRKT